MQAAPFSALESAVQSAIQSAFQLYAQQHPELASVSPQWQPMAGGSSNRLYSSVADSLVLRVNAAPEQVPGVDRRREADVLTQLQGQPWAPWVLHCAVQPSAEGDHGWLLTRWHGDSPADGLTAAQRAQLLDAVAAWQALELDVQSQEMSLEMDYDALLAGYGAMLAGLPMERALQQLVVRAARELALLPEIPRVLTHHDLHPGNLCLSEGALVVVDWEYAALGSAWFDAAALVQRCGLDAAQIGVLPAFANLDAKALAQGLARAGWLCDALECLWYWARGLGGTDRKMADLMRDTLRLLKQPEAAAAG
ncbi:phosphotransferase [Marinobacterium sedimentorum]|uniref:phosphotransferase n=1 Tax=Marinobacterium sedimentorum TaxID=2927804 RepID=UPI0020C609C2|nr:phosphotransferase [Marinobacterium sedimentorum]MCP8686760.1 phosphotransferase [Marinobacterium sedimentorum]